MDAGGDEKRSAVRKFDCSAVRERTQRLKNSTTQETRLASWQMAACSTNPKPTIYNGQPAKKKAGGRGQRTKCFRQYGGVGSSAIQETGGIRRAAVNFLGLGQKPRSARRDAEVCRIRKARRTWWSGDRSCWLFQAALVGDALSQTPELVCAGLGELCMAPDGAVCRAEVEHGFSGVLRHRHQTPVVA